MKVSIRKVVMLGAALLAGGIITGGIVQATAPEAEDKVAVAQEVLMSFGNTLVVKKEPVDEMFSHKSHVIEYGLDCDSCHPDLFERKRGAAKEKGDYGHEAFDEGMYCGACHDGDSAFGTADEESCITCHGSNMVQPELIVYTKPIKAVVFNHLEHTEMGYECSSCHNELFAMKVGAVEETPEHFNHASFDKGLYCGACHNDEEAFGTDALCTTCHIGVSGYERMHGGDQAKDDGH